MAEINYTYVDDEHPLTTYDEVIDAYIWITDAIKSVCPNGDISFSTDFRFNNMSYGCRGLEEFKKHAFGKDIKLNNMYISVSKESNWGLIGVFANGKESGLQEYVVSSKDEMLISDLIDALRTKRRNETIQKKEVTVNYEDNSIHIGNGNSFSETVIGNNNSISNNHEEPKEKWYSKITWNIVIPIIVGVIVVAICTYLGLEG